MEVIGETEKAYSDSKFMSSKNWFSFFLCGFSIVYVAFSMGFLNVLYAEKLLFSWQGPGKSLYFSQDIFDVFWLIIAAIPNGAFSAWLFGEISAKGLQEKKKRNLFWLFTGLISLALSVSVITHTFGFNANTGAWSSDLPPTAKILYTLLEITSTIIVSIEFASICCSPLLFWGERQTEKQDLVKHIFIATVIIALYWLMLILSGIVTDKYLGGREGDPALFPFGYGVIGVLVTGLFALNLSTFWTSYEKKEVFQTTIIPGIVIPCIPIAIQILQIIFS